MKNSIIRFLFIGDIVAKIGRKAVIKILPNLREELGIDFVSANCENIAHGSGVTKKTLDEVLNSGVDFFTSGDHIFKNPVHLEEILNCYPVIRPANYPDGVMGDGFKIIDINGYKILFINLLGRVFMKNNLDCPFKKFDEIYENNKNVDCVIVDFHAETTSEKKSFYEYVRNRANIVFGTHTHVGTVDYEIRDKTSYITDIGMVGDKNSSIGVDYKNIIKGFLYQIPTKHEFNEAGEFIFNSILVDYDLEKREVVDIKRVDRTGKVA